MSDSEPTEETALLQDTDTTYRLYSGSTMEGPPIVISEVRDSQESIEREAKHIVEACLLAARSREHTTTSSQFTVRPYFGLGNLVNANNVNALVDAIINQFLSREEIQKLINPLRIDKVIPLDDKGNHVSDILVEGLLSFGRTGDAILSVLEDGSISIEAAMGVTRPLVSLNYAYNAGLCFNFKGEVGAFLEKISIFLRIDVVGFQPSLGEFDVELDDPQVQRFTGASCAFNWLAKFIANKIIGSRKEEIRQQIVTQGREQLGELLGKVDIFGLISGRIPVG
ncbi:uncharacterized protein LOC100900348 [Galendromus occidentalis]|uniref:Uncharacterized protein LOC100900348 n=1 Tax=Galendromus occidentalis TaxID=34638 RepID=A0AAJ6QSW5_9ACAR|nr:uncharacterized protein LOC100900348 [Galendromus occidentalis]